ncbi:MAG: EAL domain-containing protein [Acetobacteraceae bacterium]
MRAPAPNAEDAAVVQAVVVAGRALGLVVIAEGIENEAQRGFLAGVGCDEGQGFLLGHPQPAAALATRLLFGSET